MEIVDLFPVNSDIKIINLAVEFSFQIKKFALRVEALRLFSVLFLLCISTHMKLTDLINDMKCMFHIDENKCE